MQVGFTLIGNLSKLPQLHLAEVETAAGGFRLGGNGLEGISGFPRTYNC
jgi:hypothetical protein